MRDRVEVFRQVGVHHLHFPDSQCFPHRFHGLMRTAFRAEPIRTRMEVRLKYGHQHQIHRHLHHPVFERRECPTPAALRLPWGSSLEAPAPADTSCFGVPRGSLPTIASPHRRACVLPRLHRRLALRHRKRSPRLPCRHFPICHPRRPRRSVAKTTTIIRVSALRPSPNIEGLGCRLLHLSRLIFVVYFRCDLPVRLHACSPPRLTATQLARSSVLNRLIAPAGLSPALTPASRAHQESLTDPSLS